MNTATTTPDKPTQSSLEAMLDLVQTIGRDKGREMQALTEVTPRQVHKSVIGQYFEIWWEYSAPEFFGGRESFGPKAGARAAFIRGFKGGK